MTSASVASSPSFAQLARFRVLRELGRGAQAKVMLAHDPRLDREVALKLLDPSADAGAVNEWLHEARAVSRLTHPNIVPVFEADQFDGQPYLVFEYVEGPTLSQARRGKGAMPAKEAVTLLLGVLDALAAAHAQGLVHRDLKPSNILLGSDGRPRVMDFGIAARVAPSDGRKGRGAEVADGRIVGTPGYMSPEAARGEPPVPAMDVFSAGVMLGELLSGAPLLRETDPYRAVQRIQVEDMLLPAAVKVDQTLRGIVQRALSRHIAERYDSARSMHAALAAWLHPEDAAKAEASSPATLEFLLRRMRHKTDFPALSSSVVRIQRVATSETESLKSLTNEILKDVALTNKLLRMVNTAHFTSVAGEGIGTVSRAVALVGFAGIRNMALSVILLEHMGDKAHAAQLKEEFLRALMAGTLAEELSPVSAASRQGEEAFLSALFQNLGRLLTECYLPEEAVQIRVQLATAGTAATARDAAVRRVLGLGFSELGAGVAKAWGLPDNLQRALRTPEGEVPSRPVDRKADRGVERLRWVGRSANAMADAMLSGDGEAQAQALLAAAELYAPALGMSARDVVEAAHSSRTRLTQLAQAMNLHVAPGAQARRLLQTTSTGPATPAAAVAAAEAASDKTLVMAPGAQTAAQEQLSQTLEQVRSALADRSLRPNEVLNLVLQSMHKALDFRHVVFCLREAGTGQLVGRLALGEGAAERRSSFRFTPDGTASGNLFAWLAARGADLLISDSNSVAARLPAWYRQRINAPTFLLLPVMLKGAPIGMIYADKGKAGSIVLGEQDLGLLRALRDQAAAALAGQR
jgi:serine/threonine protein kinase